MDTGSISVTRAKTDEQIACDIRRRLLPVLDAAADQIQQRRARHAEKVAQVSSAVSVLAAVPGVTPAPVSPDQRRNGEDDQRFLRWNRDARWRSPAATVNVHAFEGHTRVHLEAQFLTPELAHAALTALAATHGAAAQTTAAGPAPSAI